MHVALLRLPVVIPDVAITSVILVSLCKASCPKEKVITMTSANNRVTYFVVRRQLTVVQQNCLIHALELFR
jgi:hypothetical protein